MSSVASVCLYFSNCKSLDTESSFLVCKYIFRIFQSSSSISRPSGQTVKVRATAANKKLIYRRCSACLLHYALQAFFGIKRKSVYHFLLVNYLRPISLSFRVMVQFDIFDFNGGVSEHLSFSL